MPTAGNIYRKTLPLLFMALIIEIKINNRVIKQYYAVNITEKEGTGKYGKGMQTYWCQDGTKLRERFDKKNGAINLSKKLLSETKPGIPSNIQ